MPAAQEAVVKLSRNPNLVAIRFVLSVRFVRLSDFLKPTKTIFFISHCGNTALEYPNFVTYNANDLFDFSQSEHAEIFSGCKYAWEALPKIAAFLESRLRPELHNRCEGRAFIGEKVFIGAGTVVEDGAMIKGPAIIGKNCQIRHNAYLREHVIIGDNCVVGNSTEVKNSIFFNNAQAPHFNYVGDSILGHKAHLGAGVILSNFKLVPGNIVVDLDGQPFDTGLRKFGALLGDRSEVGCNSVLSPGSVVGRSSVIYPSMAWRGILPENMIAKNRAAFEVTPRRARST